MDGWINYCSHRAYDRSPVDENLGDGVYGLFCSDKWVLKNIVVKYT